MSFGAMVDPQKFCDQQQAHWPHRWVTLEGVYAACSGKACSCVPVPDATKSGGMLGTMTDPYAKPVPHDHTEYVEGCFRCDLSRDEAAR